MTANPSHRRALRLPRDFALIVVGLDALKFVLTTAALLIGSTPDAEQARSAYMQPGVWTAVLPALAMSWLLAGALAWSYGRDALERQGVARVALARGARLRFAGVCMLVSVLGFFGLAPLFHQIQLSFMLGGLFEDFSGYSPYLGMGMTTLLRSIIQWVVLVLGLWLATRIALGRSPVMPAPAAEEGAVPAASGVSPRRAVAMLGAAVFASLQMWSTMMASFWTDAVRLADNAMLLLAWTVPPLVAFALTFWGGWLGAGPDLTQVRPFKAVMASVIAFVQVQLICIVVGLAWLMLAIRFAPVLGSIGGLIAFAVVYVLLYMALTVLLMRAAVRRKYSRRYL